jgi:hypothetical protein
VTELWGQDLADGRWDASYFGLDSQEGNSSQKKIALRAFLGYNSVEHLEP